MRKKVYVTSFQKDLYDRLDRSAAVYADVMLSTVLLVFCQRSAILIEKSYRNGKVGIWKVVRDAEVSCGAKRARATSSTSRYSTHKSVLGERRFRQKLRILRCEMLRWRAIRVEQERGHDQIWCGLSRNSTC